MHFSFNFSSFTENGKGILNAFRRDKASMWKSVPEGNIDISKQCRNFEEWIEIIASHEIIRTDRAHVLIAAAMLGKQVEFTTSFDHKLPSIAEYALRDCSVYEIPNPFSTFFPLNRIFHNAKVLSESLHRSDSNNAEIIQFTDYIAKRSSSQVVEVNNPLSLRDISEPNDNKVFIFPEGIKPFLDNDQMLQDLSVITKSAEKSIFIDNLKKPYDIHKIKAFIKELALPLEFIGYANYDENNPKDLICFFQRI